jgi:hypothetical protein
LWHDRLSPIVAARKPLISRAENEAQWRLLHNIEDHADELKPNSLHLILRESAFPSYACKKCR